MHNLLPEENKKMVRREYRLRVLAVFLVLLIFLGVILSLSLLPAFIYLKSKSEETALKKEILKKSLVDLENQNLEKILKETKEKVQNLKNGNDVISLRAIVENILLRKNLGIKITGFDFQPEKEKSREVSIQGVASSRESLVQFKKELELESAFKVSLPVSNFAKQNEIDFIIALKVEAL